MPPETTHRWPTVRSLPAPPPYALVRLLVAAMALVAMAACSGSTPAAGPDTSSSDGGSVPSSNAESAPSSSSVPAPSTSVQPPSTADTPGTLGSADRPAQLVAPPNPVSPAPLLVLLHGYGQTGALVDQYLGVTAQAAERGLYVLLAEGVPEVSGEQRWDAGTSCCNFTPNPTDDVGYLSGLIDDAVATGAVDAERVYLLGYSNGGFMAYRMACDQADVIAAVAVLAGADVPTSDPCEPSEAVSVLHLHGTADSLVPYAGGQFGKASPFPGAELTVARWAARNHCERGPEPGPALDLSSDLDGEETSTTLYSQCADDANVQLDSIAEASHEPAVDPEALGTDVLDWLLAQRR